MEDDSKSSKDGTLEKKLKALPKGFQIASTDHRVAQTANRLVGRVLVWDDESETWKEATTGRFGSERIFIAGMRSEDLKYTRGVGKYGQGVHYFWDKERQLWTEIPSPPKPPPEGTSLANMPGFAGGLTAHGYVRYQWDDEEGRWTRVADVPLGYAEDSAFKVGARLEAISLDDYRTRIYWSVKKKAWLDLETEQPPRARPSPPGKYNLVGFYDHGQYHEGDMAKTKGEERYFLWSKEKQTWVMLTDPPRGFRRGASPNEAYQKDGSALDRWMVWDNAKEAWVDFSAERRLSIHGRVR